MSKNQKLSNDEIRRLMELSEEEELLNNASKKQVDQSQFEMELDFRDELENLVDDKPAIENSDKSHNIFYHKIAPIKRDFLKGEQYKPVRDEIAIFMKQGRLSGADSRMSPNALKEETFKHLYNWVISSESGDVAALFRKFRILNLERYADYQPVFLPELTLEVLRSND